MRRLISGTLLSLSIVVGLSTACGQKHADASSSSSKEKKIEVAKDSMSKVDSVKDKTERKLVATKLDSLPAEDAKTRYTTLTDADFKRVGDRLGVETAAIKAVVVIEAGEKMEGFWAPGVPVVNFDRSMYSKYGSKAKGCKGNPSEKVPEGLKGYALKEWTELVNARKKGVDSANMGTFWGMFQIGGFNYKQCGCETVEEMVKLMSYSELEQLELFATFLINTGMVSDLKNKNWSSFARKYNGASYAKKGYHTRMANAYAKFKKGK